MINTHKPSMLGFLETRMTDRKRLAETLHFEAYIQSPVDGYSDGIVVMWKEDAVKPEEVTINAQSIHAMVQVILDPKPWFSRHLG